MPTVLVAQGDEDIRDLVAYTVELSGSDVETIQAACGKEALDILRKHRICLVLSDWQFSDMTGFDLLRQSQMLFPDIPFIRFNTHMRHTVVFGRIAYMSLPFKPPELIRMVSWLLR